MRAKQFIVESKKFSIRQHGVVFKDMFEKFLPVAMENIKLNSLPEMKFSAHIHDTEQPTFGKYEDGSHRLHVALMNRHPNDILRTVAHELVHYKQDTNHELVDDSGATGSPHENQANALAGVVMRNFNKQYPEFLSSKPITEGAEHDPENLFPDPDETERHAQRVLNLMHPEKVDNPYKGTVINKIFVGSTGNRVPPEMKKFVDTHVKSNNNGKLVVNQYEPDFYRRAKLGSFQDVWNKLKPYFSDAPRARWNK
jgi:hypothetical protein